ncbi:MAG: hypothetical protein RL757_3391 [Bacteroidota bacterium]|jgi:hypothetical protein
MSENRKSFIVIGLLVLSLIGFFVWLGSGKKNWRWEESYKPSDKNPFGTFVLHQLLQKYAGGLKMLDKGVIGSLPDNLQGSNYVFVGEALYLDSAEVQKMKTFVENGNTMFIASSVIPYNFYKEVRGNICNSFEVRAYEYENNAYKRDTILKLNLLHQNLSEREPIALFKTYNYDTTSYHWDWLDTETNCDELNSRFIPLGTGDAHTNFAKIKYGKGEIYLYTTPLALTNWSLVDSNRLRYASKVFSHLNPAGTIFWDEKGRIPREVGKSMNRRAQGENDDYRNGNEGLDSRGPLKYVLSQPSLYWAWYLFLGSILLYMLFRAKRRQRIIPILAQKSNTSLEFVKNIGRMYFLQNDYASLSAMKIKHFQTFIRERYYMSSREMNADFVKTLSQKSGVSEQSIGSIVSIGNRIYGREGVTENEMVTLHHLIQNFYKKCK